MKSLFRHPPSPSNTIFDASAQFSLPYIMNCIVCSLCVYICIYSYDPAADIFFFGRKR